MVVLWDFMDFLIFWDGYVFFLVYVLFLIDVYGILWFFFGELMESCGIYPLVICDT